MRLTKEAEAVDGWLESVHETVLPTRCRAVGTVPMMVVNDDDVEDDEGVGSG